MLREESISARVPAEASSFKPVQDLLSATTENYSAAANGLSAADRALASASAGQYKSANIVFDNISLTGLGAGGGYFYNVYVNLPENADLDSVRSGNFIGTLGPFEIAGAAHHGSATLDFPATEALLKMGATGSRDYVVSLVRVNGSNAPKGQVITIGESSRTDE